MRLHTEYLLDDTVAWSAAGRLRLGHDVFSDIKLHGEPPLVVAGSVLRRPIVREPSDSIKALARAKLALADAQRPNTRRHPRPAAEARSAEPCLEADPHEPLDPASLGHSLKPLLDLLVEHIPPRAYEPDHPLQAQVTNLHASAYVGCLPLCRVRHGTIPKGQQVA